MEIRLTLVFSPAAREVHEMVLTLKAGATVNEALRCSGFPECFPEVITEDLTLGVWGKKVAKDQVLQDQDRVEIYRLLKVDPKEARRTRFSEQGARSTGLFARKRPGAKAGY